MVDAAARAMELMDLATTPTALVTGTFLAYAGRAIAANREDVSPVRMGFALAAALGAVALMVSLVVVLAPLAYRSVFVYRSGVETTLLVYWVVFLSAVGTLLYSIYTAVLCGRELRRPHR